MEATVGGSSGIPLDPSREGRRRTTPRKARGTQEIEGGKRYRTKEEKTKRKKKGRNTCLKGRM